jgi:hypothetical protein
MAPFIGDMPLLLAATATLPNADEIEYLIDQMSGPSDELLPLL